MESAKAVGIPRDYVVIGLLAVIAAGVVILILMASNIIPATKVLSNPGIAAPTTPPGPTTGPNGTPYTSEQRAGSDAGAPVVNPVTSQQLGVKCPTSCCQKQVTGAGTCPGSNRTYYEQACYSYPDYANSVVDCENQKTTYYARCGVCPQASCPAALC